jgi:hypothetical protein
VDLERFAGAEYRRRVIGFLDEFAKKTQSKNLVENGAIDDTVYIL